jgi:sRNA-binding carbon storage regulator CsrA
MSKHKKIVPGLVLLRKRGEAVIITIGGARVEVRLTEINPHWGRLRIVAPPEVRIDREELEREEEAEPCAS